MSGVVGEASLEWNGDSLSPTPANEGALLHLASATSELEDIAHLGSPDREAVGSRAPYFRASTADGDRILKLNVSDAEAGWSTVVSSKDLDLAPRTYGSGTLADTSIRWLLQERVGGRVGTSRGDNEVMMDAGARFHRLGREAVGPAAPGGHPEDAAQLGDELWAASRTPGAPAAAALLAERASEDWARLLNVVSIDWCHGDLHPGNVVRRAPDAPGLLIGFNPRRAPWVFDAGWLAGIALVLDVKPLYRWLFDLLRGARHRVLGERLPDRDYERVVTLVGAWYALMCWKRQPTARHRDEALRALVEHQLKSALV